MAPKRDRADLRQFRDRTLIVAVVLLAVAAVIWLAWKLSNLLFMIFVALFVTIAFEPAVHWLEKKGWKRGLATGAVMLAALLAFAGFFTALAPLFVAQVRELIEAAPRIAESAVGFVNDTLGTEFTVNVDQIADDLVENLRGIGEALAGGVLAAAASFANFLLFATTVALFSFFMLAEMPKMQRTVLSFMPEKQQVRALKIWDVAVEKMGGYIYSRLVLAVISAVIAWSALALLGVPFSPALGVWVGVLSQFVPVVGTYLAMILPILVALTFNDLVTVIWIVVIFVLYQQVENYLVAPWITKRTMEIHPAVSVGAILAGGYLLGGVGVILALPVAGIVQAVIGEYRKGYHVVLDDEGFMAKRHADPETTSDTADADPHESG
jgi:predicted PurR-regulated permease PerM